MKITNNCIIVICVLYCCCFLSYSISTTDKSTILSYHNLLRQRIANGSVSGFPSSSDMNSMLWDDALSAVAQEHADLCVYEHNSDSTTDFDSYADDASFVYYENKFFIGENMCVNISFVHFPKYFIKTVIMEEDLTPLIMYCQQLTHGSMNIKLYLFFLYVLYLYLMLFNIANDAKVV